MELHIPASRLERRIRLLLRAYPPGYRAERGEEMLGTLLEATPDGRDWPSARDAWSLLAGGTRARRASNRQLGPATSLRQAVVLGLALYISWASAEFFMPDPLTRAHGTPMLAGFLLAVTALAIWAGHRTLMITTAAAGLAVIAYYWYSYAAIAANHPLPVKWMVYQFTPAVPLLLGMLVLVHLARRDGRPPRSWLILACAPPLAMLATRIPPVLLRPNPVPGVLWNLLPDVFLLLAIPALAWLATDARPALGVALALVVTEAVPLATNVQADLGDHFPVASLWQSYSTDVEKLALAVVMTVAMAWMLRRRTRPHPR
jgi:hypothetical protein